MQTISVSDSLPVIWEDLVVDRRVEGGSAVSCRSSSSLKNRTSTTARVKLYNLPCYRTLRCTGHANL